MNGTEPRDLRVESLPFALTLAGIVFLGAGVVSLFEVLLSLGWNRVSINPGVLGLFIGIGLLRRRPLAHAAALGAIWLALLALPAAAFATVGVWPSIGLFVFGRPVDHSSPAVAIAAGMFITVLCLWQLATLQRYAALFRSSAVQQAHQADAP